MKETLKVLNQLERDGFIRRYAIGGAIGALYYIEPFETEDLDVLILLPPETANSLTPLSALYEELHRQGYSEEGPYIIIHGIPVQFIVAYNSLIEEAIAEAREVPYEEIVTCVPTPEHLAAIMVDTGRTKDRARFDQMREQATLDNERLRDIIERNGLMERFLLWTHA